MIDELIKRNRDYVDAFAAAGGESKLLGLFKDNIGAITELAAALRPFADFVAGPAADALPGKFPVSQGSPMARRQIMIGDCRRARDILLRSRPG